MGWKKILKTLRDTGQDALGTARDKIVQSIPFPSKEESDAEETHVPGPLRSSRKKDRGRGRLVDLDAEKKQAAADAIAAGQAERSSGKERKAPEFPPPQSSGASTSSPSPGTNGRADAAVPLQHRMRSTIELIEDRYEQYGSAVAATILTYALQSGGMQRLVLRLGGTPWNDDRQNHEELGKYLKQSGSQAFLRTLGITSGGAGTSGTGAAAHPKGHAQSDVHASGKFRVKSHGARLKANPPPGARADGTTGGNPRLKLEGEHFKPVKLQEYMHRLDAMGRKGIRNDGEGPQNTPESYKEPPVGTSVPENPPVPVSPAKSPDATHALLAPQMPPTSAALPSVVPIPPPSAPPASPSPAAPAPPAPTSLSSSRPATPYQALWNPPIAPGNADTQELKSTPSTAAPAAPPSSSAAELLKRALEE